ncbi:hypothetical protein F3Y22_tig00111095pilonHSYRG00883 [Hibiscus syriacus]|uniref:Uncharacterized protein n=1 Tax=Hibiscus syriacus TaxID=106335 RepID=A0A6A2Z3S0_HIBSY|nr:hypothetical protein F3Y22_tig00111095pilonHSYRG00883 [Hibiscus syriacus]
MAPVRRIEFANLLVPSVGTWQRWRRLETIEAAGGRGGGRQMRLGIRVEEDSWVGNGTSAQFQFREKLMDLLKIPYDQNEYESLWQEVTSKTPVQGARELRCGILKLYSTNTDGKSYLD